MKGVIKKYKLKRRDGKTISGLTISPNNHLFRSNNDDEEIETLAVIMTSLSPSSISIDKEYENDKIFTNPDFRELIEDFNLPSNNHQKGEASLRKLIHLAVNLDVTLFLRLHGTLSASDAVSVINDNGDSYIYFEDEIIDSSILEILKKRLPDWKFY